MINFKIMQDLCAYLYEQDFWTAGVEDCLQYNKKGVSIKQACYDFCYNNNLIDTFDVMVVKNILFYCGVDIYGDLFNGYFSLK